MALNKANVICFEDQSHGSIFYLKASKRQTPISDILEQPSSEEDAEDNDGILLLLFDLSSHLSLKTSSITLQNSSSGK